MKHLLVVLVGLSAIAHADTIDAVAPGTLNCTVVERSGSGDEMFGLVQPPAKGDTVQLNRNTVSIQDFKFSGFGQIPLKNLGARLIRRPDSPLGTHFEGVASSRTSIYTGVLLISQEFEGKSTATLQILRKAFSGFTAPLMSLFQLQLTCTTAK